MWDFILKIVIGIAIIGAFLEGIERIFSPFKKPFARDTALNSLPQISGKIERMEKLICEIQSELREDFYQRDLKELFENSDPLTLEEVKRWKAGHDITLVEKRYTWPKYRRLEYRYKESEQLSQVSVKIIGRRRMDYKEQSEKLDKLNEGKSLESQVFELEARDTWEPYEFEFIGEKAHGSSVQEIRLFYRS